MEIVEGEDTLRDDLAGPEAMAEERAGEAGNVGVGIFGEGTGVELESLVFDVNGTVRGEGLSVAGTAGGMNAVEHIDTLPDHFEELGGGAQAHGVAGLVLLEERFGILDGGKHFGFGLPDRDSANGVAVQIEVDEFPGGLLAEIGIDASLDNAEVELSAVAAGGLVGFNPVLATFSPASGEAGGLLGILALAGVGRAFVEEHGDVGAKNGLDLHALLGAEHHAGAVEMALKLDALFGDFSDFGQRPNLKAAGVGEQGPVPGGEGMEAAEFFDHLGTGAKPEVVGVCENDLRLHHVKIIGMEGFDRTLGADRHEDGGFDDAVRSGETAAPCFAGGIGMEEFEHDRWDKAGVSASG